MYFYYLWLKKSILGGTGLQKQHRLQRSSAGRRARRWAWTMSGTASETASRGRRAGQRAGDAECLLFVGTVKWNPAESLCSAADHWSLLSGHKDSRRHRDLPSEPSKPSLLLGRAGGLYWRTRCPQRGQVTRCDSYLHCQWTQTVQEVVGRPGNQFDSLGVGRHVHLRDTKRHLQFTASGQKRCFISILDI